MAIKVKPITLWRSEVEDRPGTLAATLEPLARAGADLKVVMSYHLQGTETRAALELIFSDHFSRKEPGVFTELRDTLLTRGDHYMHLADLKSYLEADQRLVGLYAGHDAWARKAILNVAGSGKFSSDRTLAEYAAGIWNAEPCPVP